MGIFRYHHEFGTDSDPVDQIKIYALLTDGPQGSFHQPADLFVQDELFKAHHTMTLMIELRKALKERNNHISINLNVAFLKH